MRDHIDWLGAALLIEGGLYGRLRDRLEREPHPDSLLEAACLEVARKDLRHHCDPEEVKAHAQEILRQTKEKMEAAG